MESSLGDGDGVRGGESGRMIDGSWHGIDNPDASRAFPIIPSRAQSFMMLDIHWWLLADNSAECRPR